MPQLMSCVDCVVHYSHIQVTKTLRELTESSLNTLLECKRIRLSLSGDDLHLTQCESIPNGLDKKYFIHKECFKKFTKARAINKWRKQNGEENFFTSKIPRFSRDKTCLAGEKTKGLSTNICMICKKQKLKVKGKEQCISRFINLYEESTFKNAVMAKDDHEMKQLVSGIDLISNGFQKHEKCYNEYTSIVWNEPPTNIELRSEKGNFMAVCQIIDKDILTCYKCISMDTLIAVYSTESNQRQYRQLLHQIVNKYGNLLIFLNPGYQSSHVIINKECIENKPLSKSGNFSHDDDVVKQAASILRASVEDSIRQSTELSWPPTIANLKNEDRKPPSSLALFYELLLSGSNDDSNNKEGDKTYLVNSFSDDVVYAISNGTFLTLKHCSIGLGLHNMTSQTLPIKKLSNLGHCITCEQVDAIQSSLTELVEHFETDTLSLTNHFVSQKCKEAVSILTDGGEVQTHTSNMTSSEETEALKEQVKKLKDEHEKEINQMREDYGFVIATLKLGSSSDAIIELQAKINEQEHEMEKMKMEFGIEKVNLVNKAKRAESGNMFALRRNEEMSNKIYAMQIELEEMDDKHQAEIESYQEKLAAFGGDKGRSKESEKQGGTLKNKRKLMKKELEELRNEHERKMESFANKIQEEKNYELKEMTEKLSKLEKFIDDMKLGHIRTIKTLEESHRDENLESLRKEKERAKLLEIECSTLKLESDKRIEDLARHHKEDMDRLRKYYEKEIGDLKRRKVSKSQALRRKTSVDTASLILKALKEQNERDEQEENARKINSSIANGNVKNIPQNTVDDMDLQKSMETIRIVYSEEFSKTPPCKTENLSDTDKLKLLMNEKDKLSKKLIEIEEAHKIEIQSMNDKYNEMKTSLENEICSLKNNENIDINKTYNNSINNNKNETNKDLSAKNIKQSIHRFDKRMDALREKQHSINKDNDRGEEKKEQEKVKGKETKYKGKEKPDHESEENKEKEKWKRDEVDTKESNHQADTTIPQNETNGCMIRPTVEIMLKMGENQESIVSRKTSMLLPDSPKTEDKTRRTSTHIQRPDPGGLNPGSSSPRLRANVTRRASGTVQRRKTLYENIYNGAPPEGSKT